MVLATLFAVAAAALPSFFVPAARSGIPSWMQGPLADLIASPGLTVSLLLIAAMYAGYLLVVRYSDSIRPAWALAAILAVHLVFLLAPPLLSTDVFGYLAYGRLWGVHGLNPYTHAVDEIPTDVINNYLSRAWPESLSTPYGPLFILLASALAKLPIAAGLWFLKVLSTASALACTLLVWRCAKRQGRPAVPAVLFVGLNPLWLAWAVAGAHNDTLMMLLVVAGVTLAISQHERLAGGALALAIAVKATAGLVLAFLWVGSDRRGRVLVGALSAGAAIAVISLAALGTDVLHYPATLAEQGSHVSRQNVPQHMALLLGFDGIPAGLKVLAAASFFAVIAALLFRVWRGADWIVAAGWGTVAFLLTTTSLHPWYIVALLPLAAIADSARLRVAALAMTMLLTVVQLTPL